jgi:hypothetical protein
MYYLPKDFLKECIFFKILQNTENKTVKDIKLYLQAQIAGYLGKATEPLDPNSFPPQGIFNGPPIQG